MEALHLVRLVRSRVRSGCLLPDHVLTDDSGLALVCDPAIPSDFIKASLPPLNNLALDLGGLPECDSIMFLEDRDGHRVSLFVLAA